VEKDPEQVVPPFVRRRRERRTQIPDRTVRRWRADSEDGDDDGDNDVHGAHHDDDGIGIIWDDDSDYDHGSVHSVDYEALGLALSTFENGRPEIFWRLMFGSNVEALL
jgi:hypothetical protein